MPDGKTASNIISHIDHAKKEMNDAISQLSEYCPDHFVEIEVESFQIIGRPKPMPQIQVLTAKRVYSIDKSQAVSEEIKCSEWSNCIYGAGCKLSTFKSDDKKKDPDVTIVAGVVFCRDFKKG